VHLNEANEELVDPVKSLGKVIFSYHGLGIVHFHQVKLMQEHRLQSQRRKHGGKDMTSHHDKISNQHLTQK
jgi:hypothetical protein